MYQELFALAGVWALCRMMLAGPKYIKQRKQQSEWDQTPVVASQIDHDLAIFAQPDSKHPDNIGRLRQLQEQRNFARAQEARPMLDQFFITKDNNRKLELIAE
jgi:hypothetical protein